MRKLLNLLLVFTLFGCTNANPRSAEAAGYALVWATISFIAFVMICGIWVLLDEWNDKKRGRYDFKTKNN